MSSNGLIFLGSKKAGLEACRRLTELLPHDAIRAVICPDDSADQRSVLGQFVTLAQSCQIDFMVVKGSAEAHAAISKYAPSVAIVLGWYQLLPVADFPNILFLGFHYSPLPKYRGNAPIVWQIINGEARIGVSFFQLTEGMDEGDLVDQDYFSLSREEGVGDALEKADQLVKLMLNDFVGKWMTGKLKLSMQPTVHPTYCGLRLPQDGLIDWTARAAIVHDFIRAQTHPYPGAFTHLPDDRVLKIWKSQEEQRTFYGVPGSVVEVGKEQVVVACGDGAITLKSVQIDGGVETAAPNILRSLKLRLR